MTEVSRFNEISVTGSGPEKAGPGGPTPSPGICGLSGSGDPAMGQRVSESTGAGQGTSNPWRYLSVCEYVESDAGKYNMSLCFQYGTILTGDREGCILRTCHVLAFTNYLLWPKRMMAW